MPRRVAHAFPFVEIGDVDVEVELLGHVLVGTGGPAVAANLLARPGVAWATCVTAAMCRAWLSLRFPRGLRRYRSSVRGGPV